MAANGDMKAHVSTYHSIIRLLRVGAVACFFIALFIIWLIHK